MKKYKSTGNDRKEFEKGNRLIYGLEFSNRKDFIFHPNSGMNQVLAKIAHDKNDIIGFDFEEWRKSKNKSTILRRMQHNMRLCRKYKVKYEVMAPEHFKESFERLLIKRKLF